MVQTFTEDDDINILKLVELVKKSNFFNLNKNVRTNNSQLRQIILKTVELPLKLEFYISKQNIITLEGLLNTETKTILRCRNIGERTIVKSRRIILDYLNKIGDRLLKTKSKKYPLGLEDHSYFVGKYFPLLKGTFVTTRLYYNLIKEDISRIKLPKRIKVYIKNEKKLKFIYDLLHIDYDDLIKEQNIGHKTIGKLQTEIIELLNLKQIIFLTD